MREALLEKIEEHIRSSMGLRQRIEVNLVEIAVDRHRGVEFTSEAEATRRSNHGVQRTSGTDGASG